VSELEWSAGTREHTNQAHSSPEWNTLTSPSGCSHLLYTGAATRAGTTLLLSRHGGGREERRVGGGERDASPFWGWGFGVGVAKF
jgi:hypothetical protein